MGINSREYLDKRQEQEIVLLKKRLDKADHTSKKAYLQGYFDNMKRKTFLPSVSRENCTLADLTMELISEPELTKYLLELAESLGLDREAAEIREGVERGSRFSNELKRLSEIFRNG